MYNPKYNQDERLNEKYFQVLMKMLMVVASDKIHFLALSRCGEYCNNNYLQVASPVCKTFSTQ